ncbi:hypothetical protein PPERSA_04284 [Pseudocohnilembus persalinus]|uniref:CSC1/OSCA1-like cytosolic domain-containing protein n=1 Tax=Pseudocohnilembus persalinus TaxID=266149 RepID=A0A0V0QP50_PSEPJ|nr:hypothetical protein PPERSA_04284 [Pseudocohnilembus persalinus]|eukprot:KRX03776.1 hypothetical protein PPERSA_04284 [Pseudocohnilembus persalinus]
MQSSVQASLDLRNHTRTLTKAMAQRASMNSFEQSQRQSNISLKNQQLIDEQEAEQNQLNIKEQQNQENQQINNFIINDSNDGDQIKLSNKKISDKVSNQEEQSVISDLSDSSKNNHQKKEKKYLEKKEKSKKKKKYSLNETIKQAKSGDKKYEYYRIKTIIDQQQEHANQNNENQKQKQTQRNKNPYSNRFSTQRSIIQFENSNISQQQIQKPQQQQQNQYNSLIQNNSINRQLSSGRIRNNTILFNQLNKNSVRFNKALNTSIAKENNKSLNQRMNTGIHFQGSILYEQIQKKQQGKISDEQVIKLAQELEEKLQSFPPDLELAKKHGKAVRVCKYIDYAHNKQAKCMCCGKVIDNELLNYCDHPEKINHIGAVYPLYFSFIKQCFIFILVMFLIQSLPTLIVYLNHNIKTGKDFSIIVKHFPKNATLDQLEEFLEQRVPGSRSQINRMFVLYDLSRYEHLANLKKKYIDKINYNKFSLQHYEKSLKEKRSPYDLVQNIDKYQQLKEEVEFKMADLNELLISQQYKNQEKLKNVAIDDCKERLDDNYTLKFTGKIIITFSTFQMKRLVKHTFKKNFQEKVILNSFCFSKNFKQNMFKKFYFNDQKLLIKDAPEPSDILWTGMSSVKNKTKIRIKSDLLVFTSMFIFLVILIFFKVLVKQATSDYSAILQTGFNLIAATLVALANVITGIIIRKNATKEDRTTQTSYFIQVGRKLTKMFMVNMLLTTFFSSLIYNAFILTDDDKEDTKTIILFVNYLIGEYFYLFITNSYISSVMSISDIVWIIRLLKRYLLEKSIKLNKCWKSQAEANELYEGHPIDMALRYANVLKVVLYTLAISSLLPVGAFMCLIGLVIIYWADKHLLYKRMVCKNYIATLLNKEMFKVMHLSIVYFAIGNLIVNCLPLYDEQGEKFTQQFYASRERKIQQNILKQVSEQDINISQESKDQTQKSIKEFFNDENLVQNQISSIKCNQNHLQSKSLINSPQSSVSSYNNNLGKKNYGFLQADSQLMNDNIENGEAVTDDPFISQEQQLKFNLAQKQITVHPFNQILSQKQNIKQTSEEKDNFNECNDINKNQKKNELRIDKNGDDDNDDDDINIENDDVVIDQIFSPLKNQKNQQKND